MKQVSMRKVILFCLAFAFTFSISCRKKKGCTDKCAKNFSNAKSDDGSCEYVRPIIDYLNHYSNNCKPPYGVSLRTDVTNISCDMKYEWNFGDGTTSTEKNPYHVYNSSGVFLVTVKAINNSEEATRQATIILDTSQAVVSKFGYLVTNNSYQVPCEVTFYNYSDFTGTYYWDFGDGTTSTQTNPVHTYYTSGNFLVSLKSSCGSKEAMISKNIGVLPKPTLIALTKYKAVSGRETLSSDKGTPLYVQLLYNNSSKMFSNVGLFTSFPASWLFPADVGSGNYKVTDNFFNNDFLTFKLWVDDLRSNDKLLYSSSVDFEYLSSRHYPTFLNWETDGYRIEINLSYQ